MAIVKTYSSFLNYLSSTNLAISPKVTLTVKKKIVPLMGSVQFIHAALVANASKVDVTEF